MSVPVSVHRSISCSGYLVCNYSYGFMPIFLKLDICFCHGLKMCMWFGYNPQTNFCHFFCILNLVIFQAWILPKYIDSVYLVCGTPPTVFVMVWKWACGLELIFVIFFPHFELSHFSGSNTTKVYRQWVPCVWNSSYSFLPIFLKFYRCFCHGLKMCMWFEYDLQINFYNFFHIWRLQASVMLISSYSWHLVGASMSHISGSNTTKVYRWWVPCVRKSS